MFLNTNSSASPPSSDGEFVTSSSTPSIFWISRLSWFKVANSSSAIIESFGFGNSKYLGGKTKGFFFALKTHHYYPI